MNSSSPQVSEAIAILRMVGSMTGNGPAQEHWFARAATCAAAMQSACTPTETAWDQPDSRVSEEDSDQGVGDEVAVARAICGAINFNFDGFNDATKDKYLRMARAAIAALSRPSLEPSDAALRAAFIEGFNKSQETSAPAYLAWELSDTFAALQHGEG